MNALIFDWKSIISFLYRVSINVECLLNHAFVPPFFALFIISRKFSRNGGGEVRKKNCSSKKRRSEWACPSRAFFKNKLIREAGLSSTLASSENLIHCRWRDPLILSSNRIHNLPTLSPLPRPFRHSSLCVSVLYPLSPRGESWKILEAFESLNPVISSSAFSFFLFLLVRYTLDTNLQWVTIRL